MKKEEYQAVLWLISPALIGAGFLLLAKLIADRKIYWGLILAYVIFSAFCVLLGFIFSYFFLEDPDVVDKRELNSRKVIGSLLFVVPLSLATGFVYGILTQMKLEGYEKGWAAHGTYGFIVGAIFAMPLSLFYGVWVFIPGWYRRLRKR